MNDYEEVIERLSSLIPNGDMIGDIDLLNDACDVIESSDAELDAAIARAEKAERQVERLIDGVLTCGLYMYCPPGATHADCTYHTEGFEACKKCIRRWLEGEK